MRTEADRQPARGIMLLQSLVEHVVCGPDTVNGVGIDRGVGKGEWGVHEVGRREDTGIPES
jgi:hypothetical protein